MQGLLHWLIASPLRAGLAAAALAVSRLFDVFGAGLLALVVLRRGHAPALQMIVVALPLVLLAGYLGGLGPALAVAVAGLWIPVLLLSLVLRKTGSLALMVQAGAVLVSVLLAAWFVIDSSPLITTREFLETQILPLMARMEGAPSELSEAQLSSLVVIAPGMMAAGGLLVSAIAVIVGRWWQAIAFNPGGFHHDFHRLRHGRTAALVVASMLVVAMLTGHPVVIGFALVGALVMVFQGLAVVHGSVAASRQSGLWLWGMYGSVLLLPLPAIVLLAFAGGLDNWMNFRRLAGQDAVNSNE